MKFGYREVCLDHDTGGRHPESPDRIRAIRRGLEDRHGVEYVNADSADDERILAVHDVEYVDALETFCARSGGNWDADTVASEKTPAAARASAGLAEWAARTALGGAGGRDTPFALGRPPGHHAVADDAMGFCFFNNAAVAAQSVIDSNDADRVAILDWDVHHGNGIQEIFYDQNTVFYVSLHEDGLYPGTGAVDEIGEGLGKHRTMNLPMPPGTTGSGYLAAFDELVAPSLDAFGPDLLLVSAGFDAHQHDPISRTRLTTEDYGRLTERVLDIAADADAGLGFVLEGGYGLDTLSESVRMVHEVFDGYRPTSDGGEVQESAREVIDAVAEQGFQRRE